MAAFLAMDPARWRQIERFYHAALAHPAEGRGAFLAEACGGDDVLRQEVQGLLDAPPTAQGLFAGPAVAAAQLVSEPPGLRVTGRRL